MMAAIWLPFFVLWAVMNRVYFSLPIERAVLFAATATSSAAGLGAAIWWLSGKLPWPDRFRPAFYFAHLTIAALYSALWIVAGAAVGQLSSAETFTQSILDSGWRFVMGMSLYWVVAGISYGVRLRARWLEQRELALRAEALAAQARLGQLRSRLNPHFLFNALHTVSFLIGHDAASAQTAVERLGEMLRYLLNEEGDLVTLEREWAFTEDYLALEALRVEDRLVIDADLDPSLMGEMVPVFALQTLVENAVRHAVAKTSERVRVSIRAVSDADLLVLEVSDDGPGRAAPVPGAEGHAGGLSVLRDRLEAHFGSSAGLETDFTPGPGFTATVRIPRSSPPPADAPQVAPLAIGAGA